ncbi:MAG TPA: HAD family phosphatase [Candidatus Methanoperedens sp.]|nr:HAD family phosphatase [Candidatus Methanoperedens sp.]
MIKAITFDLDGVYFSSESFSNFKKSLKIDNFNDNHMTQFKKGELSEDQFWNLTSQEFNLKLSKEEIFKALADAYTTNQDVVDTVRKVRKLGIKTCICTNNFPTRINALNRKFMFLNDFDVQVFSYQVGAIKPEAKIFQTLIEKSACQPSEIIFADDKQSNVDAALSLNINAFLYKGFPDFLSKTKQLGVML